MPKLSKLGEFGLIARLGKILPTIPSKSWQVGIGDDCAVRRISKNQFELVSQDLLLEGVHFLSGDRKHWESVGWKALAVNLSDIAAMGGKPLGAVVGLGLPKGASLAEIEALYRGISQAATRFACPIVGGDTNLSRKGWVIAITVLGETWRSPLLRSGARSGDSLWVTGELGGAALAWQALRRNKALPLAIRNRLNMPVPRLDWGQRIAAFGKAGAMIDLSDGLAGDLGHLVEASGLGFEVWIEKIPQSRNFETLCKKTNVSLRNVLLRGGEDYELLFTIRKGHEGVFARYCRRWGIQATQIGNAHKGKAIRWMQGDKVIPGVLEGFRHF